MESARYGPDAGGRIGSLDGSSVRWTEGDRVRDTFVWDPVPPGIVTRAGRPAALRLRASNFGDLLARPLVRALLDQGGVHGPRRPGPQLLTIGSVLHHAADGSVVWGSGWNPKIADARHRWSRLDVRAVRGPLTADFLRRRGVTVPDVFGDPALLVPRLIPDLVTAAAGPRRFPVTYVPNLNERRRARLESVPPGWRLDPRDDLLAVLRRIARSAFVVGSSLHAVIVAESLGVPARFLAPHREHELKYRDYLEGTGRQGVRFAADVGQALDLGGMPEPVVDLDALTAAFPYDLWR